MLQSEACATCGKKPPTVDTNYTLFSSKFGWRLSKQRNADGTVHIDWLCPDCWKAHKSGSVRAAVPAPMASDKDEASASSTRPAARRAIPPASGQPKDMAVPAVAAGARSREPKH
jgi:hypothetical protein